MAFDSSLLDLKQFAALSGLSESTIRRRVRDGSLAAYQPGGVGKKLRFSADALERCKTNSVIGDEPPTTTQHKDKPLPGRRPGWTQARPNHQ